ncbi:MAG: lytic transglycosylase domain-containing protein [Thermoanaerobaculia bacterium]|nr:lytic transglycosylase domain-containing protein [Thermoanaerobaculia bacterium]
MSLPLLALALSLLGAQGAPDAAVSGTSDPRIDLVRHQLRRDERAALELTQQLLEQTPEIARRHGLLYLRGHLLLELDRRGEATQAFADAMGASPDLAPWSRLRLAREQADTGHPEVAAGLLATLLGSNPPRQLVGAAVDLLDRTIRQGGDCRLLGGLHRLRLRQPDARRLELARAVCDRRTGDEEAGRRRLLALLQAETGDDVAREAAHLLAPSVDLTNSEPRTLLNVGLAYYDHREFDVALRFLAGALVKMPSTPTMTPADAHNARYALARCYFWLERWETAANAFSAVAATAPDPGRRAQALYQQARSNELAGPESWSEAVRLFATAQAAQPRGPWAAAAAIAVLRLLWLTGDEVGALQVYEELVAQRKWSIAERAALFLAASDLEAGRGDRAETWLGDAARFGRGEKGQEISYWYGRLEELRGRQTEAVEWYLETLVDDPYHPFGRGAHRQLESPALRDPALVETRRRAAGRNVEELYSAWLLLGDGDASGRRARRTLTDLLQGDPRVSPFLGLEAPPPESWPLWRVNSWRRTSSSPEEKLLTLGLFAEGSSALLRHFPIARPELAFAGSLALAESGATHRSLYVAEVLSKRIPSRLPDAMLPFAYRQLLYPFRFSYLILRESGKHEIDPYLLAAIVREESRFDPEAFSGASARGLTQFVFPTASRLAQKHDMGKLDPWDLHRPEIAVALGAAYLSELSERFDGSLAETVSAYNAGEPQAELWRSYCVGDSLEEYLTKVAFRETRNYLAKVLRSREHYLELYQRPAG